MTCKHYNQLAKIMKYFRTDATADQMTVERIALQLAEFCREQNPRFDGDKFLEACGSNMAGRFDEFKRF
jgi:hypothetical protein